MSRVGMSRPVRLAYELGLLSQSTSFFDYGCGRGDDIVSLQSLGLQASGWDPVHASTESIDSAMFVNLGFVINVIEDPAERVETLKKAWKLAQKVLLVSARPLHEAKDVKEGKPYKDGVITGTGTFQRFYDQTELRDWLETHTKATATAIAPGAFLLFRDETDRQDFLASRYRRRLAVPVLRKSDVLYETHKDLLDQLAGFITDFGRLPESDEWPTALEILDTFGSTKKAFAVLRTVFGTDDWTAIEQTRREDVLVNIALSKFTGRPTIGTMPLSTQYDIRAFFGTYKAACDEADQLLMSLGNTSTIAKAASASPIGKRTPEALYVHTSAVDKLSPILRIYEGCAQQYIGSVEGANLIKLNITKPKISYLSYPDFEQDPHPRLAQATSVDLGAFKVKVFRHLDSENRPLLHRKELFIAEDTPNFAKFQKLTNAEIKAGLLDSGENIGRENEWNALLEDRGYVIRGHTLQRKK